MKKTFFIIFILFLLIQISKSQTVERKLAVGFSISKNLYVGDYGGNGIFDFGHTEFNQGYLSLGMSVSTNLSPSFDIGFQGNYGDYGYWNTAYTNFLAMKYEASIFTHYKFNNSYIFSKNSRLSPFLLAGIGLSGYERNTIKDSIGYSPRGNFSGIDLIIQVGFGFKYEISGELAIQYQYLYNFTNHDYHDQHQAGADPFISNANDAFGELLFKLLASIFKSILSYPV